MVSMTKSVRIISLLHKKDRKYFVKLRFSFIVHRKLLITKIKLILFTIKSRKSIILLIKDRLG